LGLGLGLGFGVWGCESVIFNNLMGCENSLALGNGNKNPHLDLRE